jgi:hypothetical protein
MIISFAFCIAPFAAEVLSAPATVSVEMSVGSQTVERRLKTAIDRTSFPSDLDREKPAIRCCPRSIYVPIGTDIGRQQALSTLICIDEYENL